MLDSLLNYFLTLLPLLEYNSPYLYGVLFLSSLIESTPIIGTFVPGTIILMVVGFLTSQDYASFSFVLVVAIIGGIIGDIVGYYVGKHGKKLFKTHEGVFVYSHIETGKLFFLKHGKKSLFIGKFMGPIRPIVPFLAGLSDLPFRIFFIWNGIGTIAWTSMYILLGFLFGKHWKVLGTWSSRFTILLVLIVIGVVVYYIQHQKVSPKDKNIL